VHGQRATYLGNHEVVNGNVDLFSIPIERGVQVRLNAPLTNVGNVIAF